MNDVFLWLGAVGASLGLVKNTLEVATGKEELPKKSCGIRVSWSKTLVMFFSKMIINAFIGFSIGYIVIEYFHLSVTGAIIAAGIAGGQGEKLFEILVGVLHKKSEEVGDIL